MGLLDYFSRKSLEEGKDLPEDENEQTEEERKLAAHVRTKVEEAASSANRIAHQGIWLTNCAYLVGFDGIAFNSTTRQFQPINRGTAYLKKNRINVNKILPNVQNRLARLCKNPPQYDVMPESNDTEDKEAARLALQTLQGMWMKLGLDQKRIPLYMWLQQCGHSYMKISWDSEAGEVMVDPENEEDSSFEGDVIAEVVSAFEVYADPMCKSWEEVKKSWLIQAKIRKLDYFERYPRGKQVKEESPWLFGIQYENRINSLNSRGPAQGGMQEQMKNSAIELTKYEAPSRKYPKGRMIVTAGGILLENKDLPCGRIPYAKFDDTVVAGKYFSETPVTHVRPIQDQYNDTIRRRAAWTTKLLAGKYKAARGSGLAQESMNDESGEIVYYDPTPTDPNGPEAIPVPMIPQWAYTEEDRLDKMFNEIFGLSEISKGNLPSAQLPAIGMQLLTEENDTRIGIMTEQHEHAWAEIGSLILKYVEKYYIMPRKLKLAGKNLQYTVHEISGEDLKGNTDVMVIRGSTLPGSKTLRRQEVINAWQQGLLGDVADPKVKEKVLGMVEFGDVGEIWEDYGIDSSQVERGIKTLEAGGLPNVNEMDNHEMWILRLNRYRKGDKFSSLPPHIQDNVMITIEGHVQAIMQLSGQVPPGEEQGVPPVPHGDVTQPPGAPGGPTNELGQPMPGGQQP